MLKRKYIRLIPLLFLIIYSCSDNEPLIIEDENIITECNGPIVNFNDEESSLPRLRVVGNKIVNDNCEKVVLKGVAIIDPYFLVEHEGGIKESDFKSLKNDWNVNIIRVPIHPELYKNNPDYLQKYVDPIIKLGNQLGFYVFLSYHAHGNIITGQSEQPDWKNTAPWRGNPFDSSKLLAYSALQEMVTKYQNKPWVIYGSFNEPTFISWNDWYSEAELLVDVVHNVNDNALVIVSGVNWGYDLSKTITKPVNRKNVVYETHPYPWKGNAWKNDLKKLAKKYPVMLGEWGFDSASDPKSLENYGKPLIKFCNELGISRVAWIWHHEWTPAIFKNKERELTDFGALVLHDLKN